MIGLELATTPQHSSDRHGWLHRRPTPTPTATPSPSPTVLLLLPLLRLPLLPLLLLKIISLGLATSQNSLDHRLNQQKGFPKKQHVGTRRN